MIKIKNLSKVYGDNNIKVLDDVNLVIEEGKIYGLLGRNGAGKTSLINIITNRIFPTTGNVYIDGECSIENDNAQGKIFCMTEKGSYPETLKVKEAIYWAKSFYPDFDTEYALRLCDEYELNIEKRIGALSTGYGTILKLILSLASNARLIILDEPVLGLDLGMRDAFYKELIEVYNKNNTTLIMSTHLIEEVANILEEVIIIKEGKIVTNTSVEELLNQMYVISGSKDKVDQFIEGKKIIDKKQIKDHVEVTIQGSYTANEKSIAEKLDLTYSGIKLHEAFIKLTMKGAINNE